MIVDDALQFVYTSPVKTGTYSQVEALTRAPIFGIKEGGRHAPDLPEGVPETYLRLMSVRDPIDRYASLWAYAHRSATTSYGIQWRQKIWAPFVHDVDEFFSWLLDPEQIATEHYWVLTLTDYVVRFKPDFVIHLERVQVGYDSLFGALGWDVPKIPHSNKSNKEGPSRSDVILPRGSLARRLVDAHVAEDFDSVRYRGGVPELGFSTLSDRGLARLARS